MHDNIEPLASPYSQDRVRVLKEMMLKTGVHSINPVLSPLSDPGFAYPQVESSLSISTSDAVGVLDDLARLQEIEKKASCEIRSCPSCNSSNLEELEGCPDCKSNQIIWGRILEHLRCGYLGVEEEFVVAGRYLCPRCNSAMPYVGTDYRSLGMSHKCKECSHIFSEAVPLLRCLKCSKVFPRNDAISNTACSYHLNEEQKIRLNFDLGPRTKLVSLLKKRGYTVTEKATIRGASKSGTEHVFDIFAQRDDGFIKHIICADVIINAEGEDIGLEEVFKFDNKAYDLGIPDKVIFAIPRLSSHSSQLAKRQHITVIESTGLDNLLTQAESVAECPPMKKGFKLENKDRFLSFLESSGYRVKEKALVIGRSGVDHTIDILATRDDVISTHFVDIGFICEQQAVGIDAVFLFDTRAFDSGIHDKVLIVSPAMTAEARQFALHQRIKVYEVNDPGYLS